MTRRYSVKLTTITTVTTKNYPVIKNGKKHSLTYLRVIRVVRHSLQIGVKGRTQLSVWCVSLVMISKLHLKTLKSKKLLQLLTKSMRNA